MTTQFSLFAGAGETRQAGPALPQGFRHSEELITVTEEDALVSHIRELPFQEFEFHGFIGKRRVVSYGWQYDFTARRVRETQPIPEFLRATREAAASFASLSPDQLPHVLVTEYSPGAAIGWHRDKGVFGQVVGISLQAACTFRMRRAVGQKWERVNLRLQPRSVYLLSGPSRTEWEHSIPPVDALRYSITFRTLGDE